MQVDWYGKCVSQNAKGYVKTPGLTSKLYNGILPAQQGLPHTSCPLQHHEVSKPSQASGDAALSSRETVGKLSKLPWPLISRSAFCCNKSKLRANLLFFFYCNIINLIRNKCNVYSLTKRGKKFLPYNTFATC